MMLSMRAMTNGSLAVSIYELVKMCLHQPQAGLQGPGAAQHLRPVLVYDAHAAGRLQPRLAVHLHGHALVAQDVDLHGPALRDAVLLQVDQPRCRHLR